MALQSLEMVQTAAGALWMCVLINNCFLSVKASSGSFYFLLAANYKKNVLFMMLHLCSVCSMHVKHCVFSLKAKIIAVPVFVRGTGL